MNRLINSVIRLIKYIRNKHYQLINGIINAMALKLMALINRIMQLINQLIDLNCQLITSFLYCCRRHQRSVSWHS